jgi:hypothetical protein
MADLGGGSKCLKYTLFIFNLLFFLLGFILFIIAIVALVKTAHTQNVLNLQHFLIGYLIVSIIILVVSGFGCFGAIRESRCLLIVFIILLSFLLIICIAILIALGVGMQWINNNIDKELIKTIGNYTNSNDTRVMWDFLNIEYDCCGVNNYTDWAANPSLHGSVPDSCCINVTYNTLTQNAGCGKGLATLPKSVVASKIYTDGCQGDLNSALHLVATGLMVLVGILAFVELVGIIISCVLQRNIKEAEYSPMA